METLGRNDYVSLAVASSISCLFSPPISYLQKTTRAEGTTTAMGRKRLKLKGIQQCSTKEGEDLISRLPDDILCSILSLLPMKDDVKTSILSSRWRYLWTYRPNLEFDVRNMIGTSILERGLQDEEGLRVLNSAFVSRVGSVLQLYRGPKTYSMAVSYYYNQESFSHLDRWIEFAIAMEVEELKIILSYSPYMTYNPQNYKLYDFPCLLLSHEKMSYLKHLQLQMCDLECPPNFNGFNTLVTVDLQFVKLNESSLESFFSSCVLLEVLTMRGCSLPTNLEATGPCANLKCLEVIQCNVGKILVSAPKLASFTCCGSMVDILLYRVPCLKRLFINFDGGYCNSFVDPEDSVITRLPDDMPQLEDLYLQLITEMKVLPAKIASYMNLKELKLQAFSHTSVDFSWIGSTIDALPLLLKLHVMLAPNSHWKQGEVRMMRTSGSPHNQLKEILISGFVPRFYQTELVIYLLKNCVALERMTIDPEYLMYEDLELVSMDELRVWRKKNGEEEQFCKLIRRHLPERAGLLSIL